MMENCNLDKIKLYMGCKYSLYYRSGIRIRDAELVIKKEYFSKVIPYLLDTYGIVERNTMKDYENLIKENQNELIYGIILEEDYKLYFRIVAGNSYIKNKDGTECVIEINARKTFGGYLSNDPRTVSYSIDIIKDVTKIILEKYHVSYKIWKLNNYSIGYLLKHAIKYNKYSGYENNLNIKDINGESISFEKFSKMDIFFKRSNIIIEENDDLEFKIVDEEDKVLYSLMTDYNDYGNLIYLLSLEDTLEEYEFLDGDELIDNIILEDDDKINNIISLIDKHVEHVFYTTNELYFTYERKRDLNELKDYFNPEKIEIWTTKSKRYNFHIKFYCGDRWYLCNIYTITEDDNEVSAITTGEIMLKVKNELNNSNKPLNEVELTKKEVSEVELKRSLLVEDKIGNKRLVIRKEDLVKVLNLFKYKKSLIEEESNNLKEIIDKYSESEDVTIYGVVSQIDTDRIILTLYNEKEESLGYIQIENEKDEDDYFDYRKMNQLGRNGNTIKFLEKISKIILDIDRSDSLIVSINNYTINEILEKMTQDLDAEYPDITVYENKKIIKNRHFKTRDIFNRKRKMKIWFNKLFTDEVITIYLNDSRYRYQISLDYSNGELSKSEKENVIWKLLYCISLDVMFPRYILTNTSEIYIYKNNISDTVCKYGKSFLEKEAMCCMKNMNRKMRKYSKEFIKNNHKRIIEKSIENIGVMLQENNERYIKGALEKYCDQLKSNPMNLK